MGVKYAQEFKCIIHFQASVAEMGKCPYPGADKVPKCERPNGFKPDSTAIPDSSKSSESNHRLYDSYAHKSRTKDGSQDVHTLPPRRYDGEPVKDMGTVSDRHVVNGSPPDSHDMYTQRSQQVPYWMMHRGQGHGQRSDERSTSPRQRYGESSGTKRPVEREEEIKAQSSKDLGRFLSENPRRIQRRNMVNGDGRHQVDAPRM